MTFRLWGIPVSVHPSFLLVALFGIAGGSLTFALVWMAIIFGTTLVHELGHAIAFRRYGRPSTITLWAFGGVTQQSYGDALSPGRAIIVSLAGPLAGMLAIGVPALLIRSLFGGAQREVVDLVIWVSVAWSAVNLLPIIPLDGGHVMESAMERAWGRRGLRIARYVSIAFGLGGGIYAFWIGFPIAAAFALFFVAQNVTDLSRLRAAPMAERLREGHELLDAGDADGALAIAASLRSQSAQIRVAAIDLAAWAHLAAGRREAVATVLNELPAEVRPSKAVLAAILLHDGQTQAAVATAVEALVEGRVGNSQLAIVLNDGGVVGDVLDALLARGDEEGRKAAGLLSSMLHFSTRFEWSASVSIRLYNLRGPDAGVHAYNAACSFARLERREASLEWLDHAVRAGFSMTTLIDNDDDLALVRDSDEFRAVRAKLGAY